MIHMKPSRNWAWNGNRREEACLSPHSDRDRNEERGGSPFSSLSSLLLYTTQTRGREVVRGEDTRGALAPVYSIDSFINLVKDVTDIVGSCGSVETVVWVWKNVKLLEISASTFLFWKFRIFVAIWSCYQLTISFCLEMRAYWKKDQKTSFQHQKKCQWFGIVSKTANFAGL